MEFTSYQRNKLIRDIDGVTINFGLYLNNFVERIKQRQSSRDERTFEDYIATFADIPPSLKKLVKCEIKSELLRIQGNGEFKIGSYKRAAILYTCSIQDAPPYSKCAALAYGNRSAALYHLKEYEECVLDVDRALNLPYPDHSREKIISRKEAALSNIKNGKSEKKKTTTRSDSDLEFAHGANAKLPGASQGIDIVYSSEKERKLIANMSFKPGDILLVEKPYTMVLGKDLDPEYCYHCLKETLCLIPCDNCNINLYCSEKCRVEAYEKYHRIECRIQATLMAAVPLNTEMMPNVLRCLNILTEQGTNLHEVLQEVKEIEQCSNPEELGFAREPFVGNTRRGFLSTLLYGKKFPCDPGSFFEETYVAILLRNYTDFFQTNADILAVAKLFLSLRTPYELNLIHIPYFGETMTKAYATYPLLGVAGHACFNNTIAYHENNGTVVLRASQMIKPGDQICFNYLGLDIRFKEKTIGSDRFREATRTCVRCEIPFVYPLQKYSPIKLDKKLCVKLRRNPYNIAALWKLLNIAHENHDTNDTNDLPIQVLKMMLVDAYGGRHDPLNAEYKFRLLGIYDKIR